MTVRIAVATKDRIVVTDHFGHCNKFSILEVEDAKYGFIEYRNVRPPCNGGEHTVEAIYDVIEQIKDCQFVLVNQIGRGALQILKEKQIKVLEYKGLVTDALITHSTEIKVQLRNVNSLLQKNLIFLLN